MTVKLFHVTGKQLKCVHAKRDRTGRDGKVAKQSKMLYNSAYNRLGNKLICSFLFLINPFTLFQTGMCLVLRKRRNCLSQEKYDCMCFQVLSQTVVTKNDNLIMPAIKMSSSLC